MSDIKFSNWKWKNYYCRDCSPMTRSAETSPTLTQKPHQEDEVSTFGRTATYQEQSYSRPPEEVKAEEDFLMLNRIEDIPF